MSKLFRYLRQKFKKAYRWGTSHPIMGVGFCLMLMLIAIQIGFGVHDHRENSRQVEQLNAMTRVSMASVISQAERGEITRIVSHSVREGSWSSPRTQGYIEIVGTDGSRSALETSPMMGEEFEKQLTKAAIANKIQFERGFDAYGANKITGTIQLLLILMVIVMVLLAAQMLVGETLAGHSFKSQSKDDDTRLRDVIGYQEIKRELHEVMEHMMHADKYAAHGVRVPKGILLTGDPGVGKTMLAKALSNELKAEFFYCTGADFAEMYVGVGPRRVRALFRRARQAKRAVIFIDEIDALGSRASMGNDSERLSTLNQMLSEMDGINGNGQLLVLGATNFADRLDAALVRPGRFDKKIHIPLPDRQTRHDLMRHRLRNASLASDIDFGALADRTEGYSGAQLVAMIDEARNLALRDAGGIVSSKVPPLSQEVLERAQEIAILGVSERRLSPEDAHRTALHELGHALLGHLRCPDTFVEKVTIRGRGQAAGYTIQRPMGEKQLKTERALRGEISMLLAGRASEQVLLGDVSSGASDDLHRANALAREMVCRLGMGASTGLLSFLEAGQPGASIPSRMEEDIANMLNEIYADVMEVIELNRDWMIDRGAALEKAGLLGHSAMFEANPPVDRITEPA